MKIIHLVILSILAFGLSTFSFGDTPANSKSIPDLEKQIQDTIKQTDVTAADQEAIDRLNDLKIELIKAIDEEIKQLQKDVTNGSISSSAQRVITNGLNDDQAKRKSLSRSMGTWSTGLPGLATIPCPNPNINKNVEAVPILNAIESSQKIITGEAKHAQGMRAEVQICSDGNRLARFDVPTSGQFSVKIDKDLAKSPESPAPKVQAQLILKPSGESEYSKIDEVTVGSCTRAATATDLDKPTLTPEPINTDKSEAPSYSVTVPKLAKGKSANVRICVDDLEDKKGTVASGSKFTTALDPKRAKPGAVAIAQVISDDGKKYGPVSDEVAIGGCSAKWEGDSESVPTLEQPDSEGIIRGSVPQRNSGLVRVCVGDKETAIVPIGPDGSFTAVLQPTPQEPVTAQLIASGISTFPKSYKAPSHSVAPAFLYGNQLTVQFIGGVEQSGYSSQINNTNGFLYAYFQSPYWRPEKEKTGALWGRIRLLSGPLPSTVNVVAAVTNPEGTITSSNLTNVGQVVDYVFGPVVRLHQWDRPDASSNRISLIAGVGATTPLSSSNIQYSLQAPPANSAQCLQLLSLYPSLTNGSVAPACNLINPATKEAINTISFAPVDRSNFLLKYGAGFRFSHMYPAKGQEIPYSGSLDVTFGQDESTTGGRLHGAVFKVDGIYPLAFGASSYLYVFGSASMKLTGNKNTNPVVLATAQTPTLPLPTNVALLPLTQPDRDFYRFGVGLNITAIYCKLNPNGCATGDKAASQQAETAAKKDTTQQTKPAAKNNTTDQAKAPKSQKQQPQ